MSAETLDPNRYDKLDELNRNTWYMTEADRPFSVVMSVHSAGRPRQTVAEDEDASFLREVNRAARSIEEYREKSAGRIALGGNMSTVRQPDGKVPYGPGDLDDQGRYDDALANMIKFLGPEGANVDIAKVRVLNPDRDYSTPLSVVNADEDPGIYEGGEPVKFQKSGDFVYTYNPDIIFGVRPADCPIAMISTETPKGEVHMMVHFAWRGPASGDYEDMAREFDRLGVDRESMKVYITPGGHAETYDFSGYKPDGKNNPTPVEGTLFTGLQEHKEPGGDSSYSFRVDTPNDVYNAFLGLGLAPYQVFTDTTDTTSPEAGTASHSRAAKPRGSNKMPGEDNVRDFVVAKFERPKSRIASNPERPTPPEIEWQIVPLEVEYTDFNSEHQTGTIEVNRKVYDDVKAFFVKALELGFPIEKVVKSSDADYQWDDDRLMAANTSSAFNYRLIKGTDKPSLHGLGLAFDINTRLNPYVRYVDGVPETDPPDAIYEPGEPGVLTAGHPLVLFMKERGWEWGGDWPEESGRTDYQHFQKAV